MRIVVAFLIALGVVYLWDINYNNSVFTDGAKTMLRDIRHNVR
jgi:hypothetical protein